MYNVKCMGIFAKGTADNLKPAVAIKHYLSSYHSAKHLRDKMFAVFTVFS